MLQAILERSLDFDGQFPKGWLIESPLSIISWIAPEGIATVDDVEKFCEHFSAERLRKRFGEGFSCHFYHDLRNATRFELGTRTRFMDWGRAYTKSEIAMIELVLNDTMPQLTRMAVGAGTAIFTVAGYNIRTVSEIDCEIVKRHPEFKGLVDV